MGDVVDYLVKANKAIEKNEVGDALKSIKDARNKLREKLLKCDPESILKWKLQMEQYFS